MPRSHGRRRLPTLALLALLSACAAAGSASPSADPPDPVGAWQLVEGRGPDGDVRLVEGWPITLTIEGRAFSGTAACNGYGGRFEGDASDLRLVDLGMTAMACVDDGAMEAEAAYAAALEAVRRLEVDGDTLVLSGAATELRFERTAAPPTAELVGTAWTLDAVVDGDAAAAPIGELATLTLHDDGRIEGSTGCRTFSGTWVEQGNEIMATSLAMDDTECPAALAQQDGHVVTVIGDGFVPTVDGERLTLTDAGGAGLVYRADP